MSRYLDEPSERLEERAVEGVEFGIAQLRRLRRRLRRWMRPAGEIDPDRAIAALAAVQTALALVSPLHLEAAAERLRRQRSGT